MYFSRDLWDTPSDWSMPPLRNSRPPLPEGTNGEAELPGPNGADRSRMRGTRSAWPGIQPQIQSKKKTTLRGIGLQTPETH